MVLAKSKFLKAFHTRCRKMSKFGPKMAQSGPRNGVILLIRSDFCGHTKSIVTHSILLVRWCIDIKSQALKVVLRPCLGGKYTDILSKNNSDFSSRFVTPRSERLLKHWNDPKKCVYLAEYNSHAAKLCTDVLPLLMPWYGYVSCRLIDRIQCFMVRRSQRGLLLEPARSSWYCRVAGRRYFLNV